MHRCKAIDPKVRSNQLSTWLPAATRHVINTKLEDDTAYKGYHTDLAWTHIQVRQPKLSKSSRGKKVAHIQTCYTYEYKSYLFDFSSRFSLCHFCGNLENLLLICHSPFSFIICIFIAALFIHYLVFVIQYVDSGSLRP